MMGEAAASFQAYQVGDIRVSVVFDGVIAMPVTDELVLNASASDIRCALRDAGLPDERLTTTFAPIILQTNGKTILIDAGLGPDFGAATKANAGLLVQNMRANGIQPADIDLAIVSHFHVDYINGLLSRGMPVFPNAQIALPEREWPFGWTMPNERERPKGGSPNCSRIVAAYSSRYATASAPTLMADDRARPGGDGDLR